MIQRVALLAGLLWLCSWLGIIWYTTHNDTTSRQLCAVIAEILHNSNTKLGSPGTAGYVYYRDHPDELAAAHRDYREIIGDLPCHLPK